MSASSAADKKPNALIWALQALPEDMWVSGKLCPQESTLILAHTSKQVFGILRTFSRRMAAEHTVPEHVEIESIVEVLSNRLSCVELSSLHIDRRGNFLGESGISCLARFLTSHPAALATMKTLSIGGNFFGNSRITKKHQMQMTPDHPIPCMIAIGTSLAQLSLRNNTLNRADVKVLSHKIAMLTDLKRLDISQNSFGVHGMKSLVHAFKACRNITDVNLSGCNIMQKGGSFIEKIGTAWQGLTHLNVSSNKLRYAGMESVAKTVQHMSSLVKLDISQNELAAGYRLAIAANITNGVSPFVVVYKDMLPFLPKLHTFQCQKNCMDTNDAAEIIESMALNCPELQYVSFARNFIGCRLDHEDHNYAKIIEFLDQCKNLTTLDLSRNDLGYLCNLGGSKICQAVATSKSITELNLMGNKMNLAESILIRQMLSISTHLRVLDLCHNRLSLSGGEKLLESILEFRGATGGLRLRIHDTNLKVTARKKLVEYAKTVDPHGVIELVFPFA